MLEYRVSAKRIGSHGSVASTEEAEITLDTDIEGRPSGRPDEEDRADRCKSGRREGPARHRPCGILGRLGDGASSGGLVSHLEPSFEPEYWSRVAGGAQAETPARIGEEPGGTKMKGFVADIEELTEENSDFRRVLYTGKNLQLVLMSIEPGGEIGEEVHGDRDQFFRVEKGEGEVVIDGHRSKIKGDDAIIVPAGARHNIMNTGDKPLRLYTLYAPPEHRDGTVHATKADAASSKEHFDGKTTE